MKTVFLVLVLVGLWWWLRKAKRTEPSEAPGPLWSDPTASLGVHLRMQGERGMGGPVYGDVLCDDGVYLPHVWEMDFQTSSDGRWLLKGDYDNEAPCLIDRECRCAWVLSSDALDTLRQRINQLPAWLNGAEGAASQARSLAASEVPYESWLTEALGNPAQALVALQDLWIMPHDVPDTVDATPPALPQPVHGAVQVTLQRLQANKLRHERYPLETWVRADWQFVLDGQATPWVLDCEAGTFTWRADGKAFACYGYPVRNGARDTEFQLLVWSVERGWQQWDQSQPADRKPWSISMVLPDPSSVSPADSAALQWDEAALLQRMYIDTPELERLHDGRSISCVMSEIEGCAGHSLEGLPKLSPVPQIRFWWRKDLAHPAHWVAQSDPVAGHALHWSLKKEAKDVQGASAAYTLRWGNMLLPGLWELEHVVVQGRWALLRPWGEPVEQGGCGEIVVWDGQHIQTLDLPWPVLRLRPIPQEDGRDAAVISVMALLGVVEDKREHASTGWWRWGVQDAVKELAEKEALDAVYAWRNVAADAQGHWQLQKNWRSVVRAQHPCADGDYVWNLADGSDGLWWWGGLNLSINSYWYDEVRIEGVCITRSGAALCGVGPHALPHPDGDGWVVLEHVERDYSEPHHWLVHWIRPAEREVRSVPLRAYVPVLSYWSTEGLLWQDMQAAQPHEGEAGPTHGQVRGEDWLKAMRIPLVEAESGLWLRPQDAVYAQALQMQQPRPWLSFEENQSKT
ncbi:MAG TPA: hypothetical protein VIG85_05485 [Comamonas sp.]